TLMSQETMNDSLPYATIPEAPENYTAGSVVSRMIDGLGFRYRWATQGLTEKDLSYNPGNEGRTIAQTLNHLYGLSRTIVNSAKKEVNDFTIKPPELSIPEKRKATLENFKTASELFLKSEDLTQHNVIFKRADKTTEFPFWNNINGPIEDAVWHAGQIVVLRRSAGNPINPKVSVFLGKLRD
ncbi:MAG: DinB family protein, partial [Aurantibacter sp.]